MKKGFGEILWALKPGGQLLLVCESDDTANTKWPKLIDGMTIYSDQL